MNSRVSRYAGGAAIFSGIAGIVTSVSLVLFFATEDAAFGASSGQASHFWGPLSDIALILQMLPLLIVGLAFYHEERLSAPGFGRINYTIGASGVLGVAVLQFLLITRVLSFEQEVGPVVFATALVGLWLILSNLAGRRRGRLPTSLARLGVAVGIAWVLQPVMLVVTGGGAAWQRIMSNYFLLTASAVIFLVSYVGFPLWGLWFGRVYLARRVAVPDDIRTSLVG